MNFSRTSIINEVTFCDLKLILFLYMFDYPHGSYLLSSARLTMPKSDSKPLSETKGLRFNACIVSDIFVVFHLIIRCLFVLENYFVCLVTHLKQIFVQGYNIQYLATNIKIGTVKLKFMTTLNVIL